MDAGNRPVSELAGEAAKPRRVPGLVNKPADTAPPKSGAPRDDRSRRTCLNSQLRKTKVCRYHLKGVCQYGQECAFAHFGGELQGVPDLRKTRLCVAFLEGRCRDECVFAHGEQELRPTHLCFKKSLCLWNDKGKCRKGKQCRFAHGLSELRGDGPRAPDSPPPLPLTPPVPQNQRASPTEPGMPPSSLGQVSGEARSWYDSGRSACCGGGLADGRSVAARVAMSSEEPMKVQPPSLGDVSLSDWAAALPPQAPLDARVTEETLPVQRAFRLAQMADEIPNSWGAQWIEALFAQVPPAQARNQTDAFTARRAGASGADPAGLCASLSELSMEYTQIQQQMQALAAVQKNPYMGLYQMPLAAFGRTARTSWTQAAAAQVYTGSKSPLLAAALLCGAVPPQKNAAGGNAGVSPALPGKPAMDLALSSLLTGPPGLLGTGFDLPELGASNPAECTRWGTEEVSQLVADLPTFSA